MTVSAAGLKGFGMQYVAANNALYDRQMFAADELAWRNNDYFNFGYWLPDTAAYEDACENLMERLLALAPPEGRVLDVACGKGATTRHLLRRYGDVTAINISERQIARAREIAPQAKFHVMNATELQLPDSSFDFVICVEAAFHFDTRAKFFAEAFRVLKPGGCMSLSDILYCAWIKGDVIPRANYVSNLDDYRGTLGTAGFENIQLIDATEQCLLNTCRFRLETFRDMTRRGVINRAELQKRKDELLGRLLRVRQYLLVHAVKPG
jgi:MPBQ/MSBQ methyltransferase